MGLRIRPGIRRAFRLALRRRDLTEREVEEELRTHFALRVAQLIARGRSPAQAECEAIARLGGSWEDAMSQLNHAGRARDERLDARERLDVIRGDLGYAARTLVRQPGFASVVILTFALGIGANATMFGVIDRLLLRPPPHVGDARELFQVSRPVQEDGRTFHYTALQYPFYTALRADSAAFREVAAASFITTQSIGSGIDAEQAQVVLASSNYFRVLRTQPALGRFFGPTEDGEHATSDVVILSYNFWQRRFAGDAAILGKTIRIGPRDFAVIGVTRPGFSGTDPQNVDAWIPLSYAPVFGMARGAWTSNWGSIWLLSYVRLQHDVAPDAAAARARQRFIDGFTAWGGSAKKAGGFAWMTTAPFEMRSVLPSTQRADDPPVKLARLLVGVTVAVLLIACANVGSLLLARGTERRREIAVRLALGVSRLRLLRLLVAETAILAVAGGVVALLVAHWGISLLQVTLLSDFAWTESAFDGRVVGTTAALVVLTVAIAGIAPALRASRPDVVESLKSGGREGAVTTSRIRAALMMAQATLSVVLIVGAGLFVQSLRRVAAVTLGFHSRGVLVASMDVIPLGYKLPQRLALYGSLRDRIAALPGVAEAAISTSYPMQGYRFGIRVRVPGRDSLPPSPDDLFPGYNAVSGGYFAALGIPILDGRPITESDIGVSSRVAVLTDAMARAYWPGERAVGRCILINADSVCTTIVGVAADAKEAIDRDDRRFLVYVPMGYAWGAGPNVLVVRTRDSDARRLIQPVRRAMQGTAPSLPYADVQALDAVMAAQIRPWTTGAKLFALFGALALVIAAVGLYSAISYSVAQRRHEFGVRIALGARIGDVVRLVMDQGVRAALVGVALGSGAAVLLGSFIAPLLFQTSPRNPEAFGVAAVLIVIVAAAASFVPAWRASRVDPVSVLRGD
jgi:predicted permease